MSWREQLLQTNWVNSFLPNYMKPLNDPNLINDQTKKLIYEACEFISDLAHLSEIPRMNKTFKRTIQGFNFKIKIKQKKIFLEMADTKDSHSPVKKRLFISIYRKHIKMDNGFGKIIEATIYYTINEDTTVRSVKRHPLFQTLFHHLHRLDLSLSGQPISQLEIGPSKEEEAETVGQFKDDESQKLSLQSSLDHSMNYFKLKDRDIIKELEYLKPLLTETISNIHLLDLEEKHHITRMIQQDLPNLIAAYRSLSPLQQEAKREEVIRSIRDMISFSKEQSNDLEATRESRLNQLLKLNEVRYKKRTPS